MSFEPELTREEIRHWFFDVYFNHWVEVGSGVRDDGPEFILDYWGTPLYATVDVPEMAVWMLKGEEIVGFLQMQHALLQEAGYDHTEVPDQNVIVYNSNGGAIEVIWSRQAADNTEIQRFVVHFEAVRFDGVWKVVGMQVRQSDAEQDQGSISRAWVQ